MWRAGLGRGVTKGKLAFAINRDGGLAGKELWLSDGTEAGTAAVKTFSPSDPFGPRDALEGLTAVGSRLFFVVGDEAHGSELWTSDGTSAGTQQVKDLTPGAKGSYLSGLTASGSTLLFFRYLPETAASAERYELWRSDGTQAGTALVKDIYPGPEGAYPYELRAVGSRLFFTAVDPSHGRELWKSDGTAAGTVLVEDLEPGTESGSPRVLDALGRYLYFTKLDASAHTLGLYRVRLDGAGRSSRVRTLPNPYAGQPDAEPSITAVAVAGTRLFFGMSISSDGPAPRDVQLWATDGTAAGTRLLVRPLSLSDEFQSALFPVGDSVLFVAHDETDTNALWVLPLQRQ